MPRLIDADELKEKLKVWDINGDLDIAFKCINQAPTIDRPKAEDMWADGYYDGFKAASEWHYPSKGEYPTSEEEVLVFVNAKRILVDYIPPRMEIGELKWNGNFFELNHSDYFKDEITAWMPLPVPPQEEV